MPAQPPRFHGLRGVAYMILGCVCVGIAAVGVVLPVLPTTPFLLTAAYFFLRSSPRLYGWLLHSPLFGPFLRDWRQHRGVRPRVKVAAMATMSTAVAVSIYFGDLSWPFVVLLLALAAVGLTVVYSLPVIRESTCELGRVPIGGTAVDDPNVGGKRVGDHREVTESVRQLDPEPLVDDTLPPIADAPGSPGS